MPLLKTVPPKEAEGKLQELYSAAEQFFGSVPNNVRMLGVSPYMLENQMQFAGYYMDHPNLGAPLLTMIRLLVSHASDSPYCAKLNAGLLLQQGLDSAQVGTAIANPEQASLGEKEKAMLLFVLKAIKSPKSIETKEIEGLTAMGWSEQDIFDAVAHGTRAVATNLIFDIFKLEND